MCRDHVLQKCVALYFYAMDIKLGIMIRSWTKIYKDGAKISKKSKS